MKIHIEELKEDLTLVFQDGTEKVYKAKREVPRSWEEFCRNSTHEGTEAYITTQGIAEYVGDHGNRDVLTDRNLCKNIEEAEAFLALMQLRRLWHAWCEVLGYPDRDTDNTWYGIYHSVFGKKMEVCACDDSHSVVYFSTRKTAEEFLECFKDLFEKAKILL